MPHKELPKELPVDLNLLHQRFQSRAILVAPCLDHDRREMLGPRDPGRLGTIGGLHGLLNCFLHERIICWQKLNGQSLHKDVRPGR